MEKQLRPVRIQTDFTEMAAGSVLIECGRTRVLCTASVEDGAPPFLRGSGRGWLTAEYAMLPGSTPRRKPRDGIKKDGRGTEIQRLIGRSLRACMDFSRLGERTITVDCDVLQADGGTRTASITGGFVAVCLAVNRLIQQGVLFDSPIVRQIAAVSVGIVEDELTLDLDYARDSRAQVDMNVIMARDARGEMQFVEVQGTGEGRPFAKDELDGLLALAQGGIAREDLQLHDVYPVFLEPGFCKSRQSPGQALAAGGGGYIEIVEEAHAGGALAEILRAQPQD